MADNDSPAMASETAELSLDDIAARRAQQAPDEPEVQDETPEVSEQDAPEDEAAETVEDAEQSEEGDASEKDAEPEVKDDVLIKMDDGSTITVAELKAEAVNLKTENARISQEVATERRELQKMGQDVAATFDKVVEYLASKLPPEPEQSLIWSDPTRHHQMTFLRNSAIAELQSLLGAKGAVEGVTDQLSEADFKRYEAEEMEKLVKLDPNMKDPARYKAAMAKVASYAKSIGYDDDTIAKTKDARILKMAIDAAYGREAREAAQKAKAQVKSSVAKAPVTGRTVHPNSIKALNVQNAIKRAQSTGSLDDVLAARLARQT